jgi:hypothetical protein
VSSPAPATAIIDGALCHLNRRGDCIVRHAPLATAIVQFVPGPMRYYVCERPDGILPGLPNLYCLDGGLRLAWLAEWPWRDDPCVTILGEDNDCVSAATRSGVVVRLDRDSGRLIGDVAAVASGG